MRQCGVKILLTIKAEEMLLVLHLITIITLRYASKTLFSWRSQDESTVSSQINDFPGAFGGTAPQHTNDNVYILNAANQVTVPWFIIILDVPFLFSPSFILFGANTKSRCWWKLVHPSLLSRQVQTVIFLKNCHNYSDSDVICVSWLRNILLRK